MNYREGKALILVVGISLVAAASSIRERTSSNTSNTRNRIMPTITEIERGEVALTGIGVKLRTNYDSFGDNTTIVTEVVTGSPAELAGLQKEDIIRMVNSKPVTSAEDVQVATRDYADEEISITFERDGVEQTVTAVPLRDMTIETTEDGVVRMKKTE